MSLQNKNFMVGDRVYIDASVLNAIGTIMGCASRHITDMYIVQLDVPLPEHAAVVVPEGCLTLL